MSQAIATTWTPLSALRPRLEANIDALAGRDAALASELRSFRADATYHVAVAGQELSIGVGAAGTVLPLPRLLPPRSARQIMEELERQKALAGPIVVAGLDQGWLWDALYRTKVELAEAPGHRPPIYLLARDPERLWVVMHLHDWTQLLADPRCRILVGSDAVAQLHRHLVEHPEIPWPRINVTVDPLVWPPHETLDTLLKSAEEQVSASMAKLQKQLAAIYSVQTPAGYAAKMRAGAPLRVMGITSRYTTFLQHSMRDWLDALRGLGHETRLVIESADHEKHHPSRYLREVVAFRPDLLLLIDHYRAELPLMPAECPAVMWVQDRLPNIFCVEAGVAQGPMDFAIGYGRLDCVTHFAYPRSRFMEAPIGVNECRFTMAELPAEDSAGDRCEVAFVSHASATPESLVRQEIDRLGGSRDAERLCRELFERLNAIYAGGQCITHELALRRIVAESLASTRLHSDNSGQLIDFVTARLNNAMFRHQVLHWLADAGVKLHIYGKGWEQHPRFARFARGVADHQRQLAAIYRSAAINLQVMPAGSAHQRVFEGLCAGGFFLLRRVAGDELEPIYRELWAFIRARGLRTIDDIRDAADSRISALLSRAEELTGQHPLDVRHDLIDALRATAQGGFTRAGSTLWPDDFPRVAFGNREELLSKLRHFLSNPQERTELVGRMRQRVLETVTYRGISRRMLEFIAEDLSRRADRMGAAA